MNAKFDQDKLYKLMDQMDLDQDGVISYHEFLAYFAKLAKPIDDASFNKGMQRYLKFEKVGDSSLFSA
jgi:Ca2+-binding EF-hand superfamily protein